MPVKEKYEKVKTHLRENKTVYLVGAAGVTAGYFLGPQVVNIVDAFNFKYKSPTTTTVVTLLERRACKEPVPVRCTDTGEVFASIRRAAEMLDIPRKKISDQMFGKIADVDGFHFEPIA